MLRGNGREGSRQSTLPTCITLKFFDPISRELDLNTRQIAFLFRLPFVQQRIPAATLGEFTGRSGAHCLQRNRKHGNMIRKCLHLELKGPLPIRMDLVLTRTLLVLDLL